MMPISPLPKLNQLPTSLPRDGAISMTLEQGVPIFRASTAVQYRIQKLLEKQQAKGLSAVEEEELDRYEEIDDYLSHLNRVVRNLQLNESQ
jgi:hypothetical protein